MYSSIIAKSRLALGHVKSRLTPTAVELSARQRIAFEVLHAQAQVVKGSPTIQLAFAASVAGLVATGRWGTAVALAGVWLGSKPIAHAIAGGVAAVGTLDNALATAVVPPQVVAMGAQAVGTTAGG